MWRPKQAKWFDSIMRAGLSVVGGFFLRVMLALIPALAIWFSAREWFVKPVAWLTERVMLRFFPGWVLGTELEGVTLTLLTTIRVPHASGAVAELAPEVQILTYCYGLPMLAALLIGSRARGLWWKLPISGVALIPFQVLGCVFSLLVTIGIHLGHLSSSVTGFSALELSLFALGYQISFLLLPTIVPIVLWLQFERRFITTIIFDAVLEKATR